MLHPLRTAAVLAVPVLFAGTAFAADALPERRTALSPPAPAVVAPAVVATPVPAEIAAPTAVPAQIELPLQVPVAPAPVEPAPVVAPPEADPRADLRIVRPGTAEEGCFPDKEEYLDVWHQTGLAPDPCFIPPA